MIYVFDPLNPTPHLDPSLSPIPLSSGTNPIRFDAGAYVDYQNILSMMKETITDAPETYFDVPAHKKALLNQTKAIETLLPTNASNKAIIAKLDAMKNDVVKWVVHKETKDALTLQIDSERTFVFVQRRK
ncbi:MAG: hypothetical protein GYA35_07475 [Thermoanaerobaculaceae bacterium]|nr:hypothetical protein [Thermoanaerobaculaceae bacterium]